MKQIASRALDFRAREQVRQETSMKQIEIRAVLLKAQVYIENRKEQQDNLSVFSGCL
jgi:hypothetical protein